MAERNNVSLRNIAGQAEREMTAFLHATSEVFGGSGSPQAGETWLRTMESLDWPSENHEKFFRRVSVLTISQLLADLSSPQYTFAVERVAQGYS